MRASPGSYYTPGGACLVGFQGGSSPGPVVRLNSGHGGRVGGKAIPMDDCGLSEIDLTLSLPQFLFGIGGTHRDDRR
jgi:hypothetical protein